MRKVITIAVALALAAVPGCSEEKAKSGPPPVAGSRVTATATAGKTGEELFQERCASCHPDGGNRTHPEKTLHRGVLAKHGIKDSTDIVNVIRNPGPGMVSFDRATLSDAEAQLIADYVLTEFR